jgi:hypothetical protein
MPIDWTTRMLRRDFGLPVEPSKVEPIMAAQSRKLAREAVEVAQRGGDVKDFLQQRVNAGARQGDVRDSRRP